MLLDCMVRSDAWKYWRVRSGRFGWKCAVVMGGRHFRVINKHPIKRATEATLNKLHHVIGLHSTMSIEANKSH